MRDRGKVLASLETAFREAFALAEEAGDKDRMAELDLTFQRDQVMLEVLLDIRQALTAPPAADDVGSETSLLDKAKAIRNLTKLKMP